MSDLADGLLAANAVVALAAFIQTASGIGFAMIAVPLLALIDLGYVPGPSIFAMLGLSTVMAVVGRRDVDRRGLSILLPGLGIGTVLGALLLGTLSSSAMGSLFGGMVLTALAIGRSGIVPERSGPSLAIGGAVAGLMGTMAGIHGPALAVLYQRTAPRMARATIASIFVLASCLSLLFLHLNRLFDGSDLMTGLALWPGVAAGYLSARSARHMITDRMARNVMLGLATLSASLLIAKSLWQS